MTRYNPLLPPVIACLIVFAWIVVMAAIILTVGLMLPAHGQECRFAYQCPFVASPVFKAAPAIRYGVREVRRVRHHGRVLISRPSYVAAEINMPLVWPDLATLGTAEEITPEPSKISASLPVLAPEEITFDTASGHARSGSKPDPPSIRWMHSDDGKKAILATILLLVVATFAGSFPRLNGATA